MNFQPLYAAVHGIFSGTTDNMILEKLPTNIVVKNDKVIISTVDEMVIYDLNLKFQGSVGVVLEGRNRTEMYSKPKSVEVFDYDFDYIFCGGQANKIKVVDISSGPDKCLITNAVIQDIQVSLNKGWENFKTKLSREKSSEFNKKNFIEVLKIVSCEKKFFVLSRGGISFYEKDDKIFNPIEFNIKATPEFVIENLKSENYLKALISAIQLKNSELIKMVIDQSYGIEFVVSYLPKQYAPILLDFLVLYLKKDSTNIKLFDFLNKMIFYHKMAIPGLYQTLSKQIKENYSLIKSNNYLMKSVLDHEKNEISESIIKE